MRILIIIPRFSSTEEVNYNYNFPLGLSYISSVLKYAGYHVDCLNLNHHVGDIKNIITKTLDEKEYKYICTGNVSLGYVVTENIITSIRSHRTHPIIILGGIIVTSEPELIIKSLKPDYAVIGEGEETIIELIKCIEEHKDIKEVKGIAFLENNNLIFTEKRPQIKNLDALPLPDFEGFEFEKTLGKQHSNDIYFFNMLDNPRNYPIIASRGCPYNCTFCYHYNKYTPRSVDNIISELNSAITLYKINNIWIYDDCFSVDKRRLYEFCERIKELRAKISWDLKWSCQMTVKTLDTETLKIMKDAGCDSISYGFESYSPTVLKSMNKPITPQLIDKAFHETLSSGIAIQANFIFGDVAETKETSKETLDYWKNNCKGQINLDFIRPYPGSNDYNYCIDKGLIKNKLDFIKNMNGPYVNMTSMTYEEFIQLQTDVHNARRDYRYYSIPKSIIKESKNIYSIEIECPHCKKISTYKNCYIPNRLIYGFNLVCRNCPMRFDVVSTIEFFKVTTLSRIKSKIDYIHKELKTNGIIHCINRLFIRTYNVYCQLIGLIFYPIFYITNTRFLNVNSPYIGHITVEPDCYIKAEMLKKHSHYNAIILAPHKKTNKHFINYWKKYFIIITNPIISTLLDPFKKNKYTMFDVSNYTGTLIGKADFPEIQKESRNIILLSLTDADKQYGWNQLKKLGIPENSWFVCVHAREEGYNVGFNQTYRNANIENYFLAMKYITDKGGWILRMGDPSMKKIPDMYHVIDYAHSDIRNDTMDVFLCASCKFFLGSASGLNNLPAIFGVPSGTANVGAIGALLSYGINDISIPKLIWSNKENRILTFKEVYNSSISQYRFDSLYSNANVKTIENTPDDIKDLAIEMLDIANGKISYTNEDEQLQQRFKALMTDKHYSFGAVSRVGKEFLKKYSYLIGDNK